LAAALASAPDPGAAFAQAVPPPWEARSDWDAFHTIARKFSEQC
jgi:nitrate reductase alpha subunit